MKKDKPKGAFEGYPLKGSKQKTKRRREILKGMITKFGTWGFNQSDFAKRAGVSEVCIHKDVQRIIDNTDIRDVKRIGVDLYNTLGYAIRECRKILADEDKELKIKAAGKLKGLTSEMTEFLEAFGYKEKVADKVDVGFDKPTKIIIEGLEKEDDEEGEDDEE